MAVINRFFFWFSVRLGTIFVGILSVVQWSIWLMMSVITAGNKDDVSRLLHELADTIDIHNKTYHKFATDPSVLLIIFAVFFSFCILSSVFALIGAFRVNHYLLYPFLVIDFIYMILLLLLQIALMLMFKRRDYGIGSLILYSNVGALIILFLLYNWICVLSLLQIIEELHAELREHHMIEKERRRQMKSMIDVRYPYTVS